MTQFLNLFRVLSTRMRSLATKSNALIVFVGAVLAIVVNVFELFGFIKKEKDIGISAIHVLDVEESTNLRTIKVDLVNHGETDLVNIPIKLIVDDSIKATENMQDTLVAGDSQSYTFKEKADLGENGKLYTITTTTLLKGDDNAENNSITKEVKGKSKRKPC